MKQKIEITQPGFLPTYDECYVCGQTHPRGLRARFFANVNGQVQCQFKPDSTQTGYAGLVHGGVVSTLFDELLGWPIVLQTGRMCFSAEITIRFVKPIPADGSYLATAYCGTDRGRFWENEADLRDSSGTIYAKARGKYFLFSEEQTLTVLQRMTYQPDDLPILRETRASVKI